MGTILDWVPDKVSGKVFVIAVFAAFVVGSAFAHC